jgi:hypothetical protein
MVCSDNSSVAEGTLVVGPVGRSRVVSEAVVCASASAGSPSSITTDGERLEEIGGADKIAIGLSAAQRLIGE